ITVDELAQHQEIAVRIFLRAKDPGEDFAGGIVEGGVEDEARPPVLEPGMVAAVHLDEEAGLGHPLAPATMTGWSALGRTADARGPEQPLDCLPRYAQTLGLGQQVREVMIVHAGVAGAGQGEDAATDVVSNPPWGGAAAVTMSQGGEAMLPGLGQQATDVA